ncbi:RNA polymerase sigma factor RpoD/SigA [Bermanella sp. R86510]|uniref:sigma-70 family RNA polymerase sigma factor n=1 Tax=unclassified Bermanella TaxID=2627862 RepID=UPI0037C8940C
MLPDEVHELAVHYPNVDLIDADTERRLATNMDDAMVKMGEIMFAHDHVLEHVIDLVQFQQQDQDTLDSLITQYDLWLLSKAYPQEQFPASTSLKNLAHIIVKLDCDRSQVFDLYLQHIHNLKGRLAQRALLLKRRYDDYRNQLVQANLRLVMHVARKYNGKGMDVEELVQEGTLGLIKAAERYNLNKGYRFTTYAYWWIQQAIKGALSEKRGIVRLPTNITDRIIKLERHKHDFYKAHGYYPSVPELAASTGLDEQHIRAALSVTNIGDSIDEPVYEEGLSLQEMTAQEASSTPTQELEEKDTSSMIETLLSSLPKRQQFIVRLYHGIGITQTYPFKEIAPQIGVTLERTRQLYHESIRTLKQISEEQGII